MDRYDGIIRNLSLELLLLQNIYWKVGEDVGKGSMKDKKTITSKHKITTYNI